MTGKLDLASFGLEPTSTLELNDIGHAQLRLAAPLPLENYLHHRRTGAFLVIDPLDGNTLAAGLVKRPPGRPRGRALLDLGHVSHGRSLFPGRSPWAPVRETSCRLLGPNVTLHEPA